jgi:hypothetical protein
MAGTPFLTLGPDTVEVSVAIAAGQGVEPDPANPGLVRPWAAGSARCLGVARTQAAPAGSNAMNNFAPVPRTTAAQYTGDIRVVFAAAAAWMEPLMAAANGQVTPAPAATPPEQIIGKCSEPAGVLAGATGRARLTL